MKDISDKTSTARSARAVAVLKTAPSTIVLVREGRSPKGDPLPVAKVAAVQAAKNTSQIIPYCHPLPVDFVDCQFALKEDCIEVTVDVKAIYKTGVEMEALTGATAAVLTLYDMLKVVDEGMEILGVRLIEKRGGKSDFRFSAANQIHAAVIVLSDSVHAGTRTDTSGRRIVERLKEQGVDVAELKVLPDDSMLLQQELIRSADELHLDLVVTTGGTGLSKSDVTPEAMEAVIEREIPGIAEASRGYGQQRLPLAMLSRAKAGVRGTTIIVNLPGSKRAVDESLNALIPGLFHAFRMLRGEGH
jgi:cyclic pyranopterin monophosphate synthase